MNRPVSTRPGMSTAGGRHDELIERGVAVVVAAGIVAGAWIWATGQVAAFVASGRWAPVAVGDIPLVARRIPARVGDLRSAWPAPAQGLLPGDGVFVVVAVAVAFGFALAGFGIYRLWSAYLRPTDAAGMGSPSGRLGAAQVRPAPSPRSRLPRSRLPRSRMPRSRMPRSRMPRSRMPRSRVSRSRMPPRRTAGARGRGPSGARWATRRDLKAVTRRSPVAGRLVIGDVGGRLLTTEARHSVLVFGPTQSGKTTGLAIPSILEWEGPVLATSVKGDLAATTIGWRRRCGECWVFDPTGTSGEVGAGWSPLAEAGDWRGAQRVAGWMVEATPARSGLSEGAFWFAAAAKQLCQVGTRRRPQRSLRQAPRLAQVTVQRAGAMSHA
jgi:type IV secretion system protein VirD4